MLVGWFGLALGCIVLGKIALGRKELGWFGLALGLVLVLVKLQ